MASSRGFLTRVPDEGSGRGFLTKVRAKRIEAAGGDHDLGQERRDRRADDALRGNQQKIGGDVRGEGDRHDREVGALAVPPDHLVGQRVVEEEQRQARARAPQTRAPRRRTTRRRSTARSPAAPGPQTAASARPATARRPPIVANEVDVAGLHQHRECDRHHRRGKQPQRFNQPKRRVVSADRLKAVPLLDEVDVDAEIERGDQDRGAERKNVAKKRLAASIRLKADPTVPGDSLVVSGFSRDRQVQRDDQRRRSSRSLPAPTSRCRGNRGAATTTTPPSPARASSGDTMRCIADSISLRCRPRK